MSFMENLLLNMLWKQCCGIWYENCVFLTSQWQMFPLAMYREYHLWLIITAISSSVHADKHAPQWIIDLRARVKLGERLLYSFLWLFSWYSVMRSSLCNAFEDRDT